MHFELWKIVYYNYHLNSCNFKRTSRIELTKSSQKIMNMSFIA